MQMTAATVRCRFRAPRAAREPKPPAKGRGPGGAQKSRVAQMLALAHHIERLVDAGGLPGGYADAARALGLTRARLTQVMNLLLLAPSIQERILVGGLELTERGFRQAVRCPAWAEQQALASDCPSPERQARPNAARGQ
jgi:hypothetical protein